ncbi:hypothetical protein QAD02_010860 [Eretmocerus hayati]|uniref:Uncharacterized protein n=1 Tax=Eretmocerus hayati TaxID=131215 RepID=A0ACC2NVE0_9HYME|nr:hypothetical protein QAD02_010860 [Eretmocerus hayati]
MSVHQSKSQQYHSRYGLVYTCNNFQFVKLFQFKIGRVTDNDLVLHEETVSTWHAKIEVCRDASIYNNFSSNPDPINGKLMEKGEKCELQNGDMLKFCNDEKLSYKVRIVGTRRAKKSEDLDEKLKKVESDIQTLNAERESKKNGIGNNRDEEIRVDERIKEIVEERKTISRLLNNCDEQLKRLESEKDGLQKSKQTFEKDLKKLDNDFKRKYDEMDKIMVEKGEEARRSLEMEKKIVEEKYGTGRIQLKECGKINKSVRLQNIKNEPSPSKEGADSDSVWLKPLR